MSRLTFSRVADIFSDVEAKDLKITKIIIGVDSYKELVKLDSSIFSFRTKFEKIRFWGAKVKCSKKIKFGFIKVKISDGSKRKIKI